MNRGALELCFAQIPIRPLAGTIQQTSIQILSSGDTFRWHAHLEIKLASLCEVTFPAGCSVNVLMWWEASLAFSHINAHTHTRTYARFCRANLKEQIFFHDATSLFMSKKKKKGSLQSSPLSSVLHGGNCDTWPECRWGQTWGRLEPQQREASGGQLLQEPLMEVGNWISMHACAGATPHDGHYIHDALDSCSTHVR